MERKPYRGIKNGEKVQAPPGSSSALAMVIPWLVGHCPHGTCFKLMLLYPVDSANMSCADQSKFRGFDPSWSSKATSFLGLGSLGYSLGSPAKAVHPMRNPFQLFSWILPGCCCQKHFYSSRPNCCQHFPRCKKRVRVLSKLQNYLPGLLQPRSLYHLLNHFNE